MRGSRWLALFLVACDGGSNSNDCVIELESMKSEDVSTVAVGTGRDVFQSLANDGAIELIHGPQGGYHMLLNARIQGMEVGEPTDFSSGPQTIFSVFSSSGERLDHFTCAITYPYVANDATGFTLDRSLAVIVPNELVPSIYGERVDVRVEVLDREGRYGASSARVVVIDPEADPRVIQQHIDRSAM